jgi:hypothetical protein
MQSIVIYSLHYIIRVLNLLGTKASTHDLFQSSSSIQFSYTLMNIQKENLRKLQEIELTKTKDHCRSSRQHLAVRQLNRPSLKCCGDSTVNVT